ncbi:MAG TPA: alpha/beta hydrolase [Novosphingobium sp.]|nr:alpha/beta hydrolase [Novosphingobium sp.]
MPGVPLAAPTAVRLANGVTLDVWQEGPRKCPPLIFLHGFPESLRSWRHQIAHLAGVYRCIAPDQRGYGKSSRPANDADYATPHLVADVFALADALGLEHFGVVAHDWGGVIAWEALHADAARRIRLAIIANAPHPALFQERLFTSPAQRAASQYIRQFRDPATDEALATEGLAPLLLRLFGKGTFAAMEPTERTALLERWHEPGAAQAMLAWYRASAIRVPAWDAPLCVPDGWQGLPEARIRVPVLTLWGEKDANLPADNLVGLNEICTQLTIRRLPGVGHFAPWEAPAAVNEAIEAFLARHRL